MLGGGPLSTVIALAGARGKLEFLRVGPLQDGRDPCGVALPGPLLSGAIKGDEMVTMAAETAATEPRRSPNT